jgi:4-amino-4-deoxy-L-arabinose transferase-like glycosyltransferase
MRSEDNRISDYRTRGDTSLRPRRGKFLPAGIRPHPFEWTDLAVLPLIVMLSIPPLVWFAYEWVVTQDAGRYLLGGWHLISGHGYTLIGRVPETKRGPVFPAVLGVLMTFFGRDTESLAWSMRVLALVNPLLAYFLVKRIYKSVAGLLAAALVTLLSYTAKNPQALNVDAVLLTVYLLSLLGLLVAVQKNTVFFALLSGLLLGASIVTKETAIVNLPLALLAVLLFDWNLRGALWHYLGVVLVCLPWWVWVWSASGQVYLVGRFPTELQVPIMIGALLFVGSAVAVYLSGMVDRFLADERRRRWTGGFLTLAWVVSLTGFLLSTGADQLSHLTLDVLRTYVTERLASTIAVWPLLLVAGGYIVWKALQGGVPLRIFVIALLFQFPICLLVTIEGWNQRQFLIPQTLLLCALAVLVTDSGQLLVRAIKERRYSNWPSLIVAVSLIVYLGASAGVETYNMLFGHDSELSSGGRGVTRAREMIDWIAENVPDGEKIVTTPLYLNYLAYLDGDKHRLIRLRLDQSEKQNPTKPRKRLDTGSVREKNSVYGTPPDTVWLNLSGDSAFCVAASLSVPNVVSQMKEKNINLLMMSSYATRPGLLSSSSGLVESGAFEVAHQEGKVVKDDGFVLLERTHQSPEDVPTWMGASTVLQLKSCMQAKGPGYAERIESTFPNGIKLVPSAGRGLEYEEAVAASDPEARQVIEEVYSASNPANDASGVSGSGPD